jgi:hypothetical protein
MIERRIPGKSGHPDQVSALLQKLLVEQDGSVDHKKKPAKSEKLVSSDVLQAYLELNKHTRNIDALSTSEQKPETPKILLGIYMSIGEAIKNVIRKVDLRETAIKSKLGKKRRENDKSNKLLKELDELQRILNVIAQTRENLDSTKFPYWYSSSRDLNLPSVQLEKSEIPRHIVKRLYSQDPIQLGKIIRTFERIFEKRGKTELTNEELVFLINVLEKVTENYDQDHDFNGTVPDFLNNTIRVASSSRSSGQNLNADEKKYFEKAKKISTFLSAFFIKILKSLGDPDLQVRNSAVTAMNLFHNQLAINEIGDRNEHFEWNYLMYPFFLRSFQELSFNSVSDFLDIVRAVEDLEGTGLEWVDEFLEKAYFSIISSENGILYGLMENWFELFSQFDPSQISDYSDGKLCQQILKLNGTLRVNASQLYLKDIGPKELGLNLEGGQWFEVGIFRNPGAEQIDVHIKVNLPSSGNSYITFGHVVVDVSGDTTDVVFNVLDVGEYPEDRKITELAVKNMIFQILEKFSLDKVSDNQVSQIEVVTTKTSQPSQGGDKLGSRESRALEYSIFQQDMELDHGKTKKRKNTAQNHSPDSSEGKASKLSEEVKKRREVAPAIFEFRDGEQASLLKKIDPSHHDQIFNKINEYKHAILEGATSFADVKPIKYNGKQRPLHDRTVLQIDSGYFRILAQVSENDSQVAYIFDISFRRDR